MSISNPPNWPSTTGKPSGGGRDNGSAGGKGGGSKGGGGKGK